MRTLLASIAAVVLAGCTQRVIDKPSAVTLDRPGTLLVDLFAGDVTIRVDESLDQVQVQFTRVADHGWFRADEAKRAMESIDCRIHRLPDSGAPAIEVRATTDDPEAHFLSVNAHIRTPPVTTLTIRTERGTLDLKEVSGVLDLVTSEGDIRLRTTHALTKAVTIATSNGRITLRVPSESRGALDFHTVNGTARVWSPNASTTVQGTSGGDRVEAVLNGGENPITLRTTNGDIKFQAVEDVIAAGNYDG